MDLENLKIPLNLAVAAPTASDTAELTSQKGDGRAPRIVEERVESNHTCLVPRSYYENGSTVQNMRGTIFGSGVTNTSIMEPSPLRRAELGLTTQWQEPPNEAERKLTYIWQQVLGRDKLGASDDFFELGGELISGHGAGGRD